MPFMSLPVGPNARFLWLGMWGTPAASQLVGKGWVGLRDWKMLQDTISSSQHLTAQHVAFKRLNWVLLF